MSYARLRAELLAARDTREALLGALLAQAQTTVVFASTAVPGPRKGPPGVEALLGWGVAQFAGRIGPCRRLRGGSDRLGPYAVLAVAADPYAAKRAAVAVENDHPAARLLDLDIYGADRVRVGRSEVGEPPRPCLLCAQPAVDCIRLGRHPMEALIARVESLLESFATAATG